MVSITSRGKQGSPAALGTCPSHPNTREVSRERNDAAATELLIAPKEPMAILTAQEFFLKGKYIYLLMFKYLFSEQKKVGCCIINSMN